MKIVKVNRLATMHDYIAGYDGNISDKLFYTNRSSAEGGSLYESEHVLIIRMYDNAGQEFRVVFSFNEAKELSEFVEDRKEFISKLVEKQEKRP